MATNSDGSIVLSVNIDTSDVKSQINKINKEVLNALKSQTKYTQETEKANQALLKSELLQERIATQQEKRNREQIKTEQTLRAERAKADKELERKKQAEANRSAAEERSAEKKRIAEVKLQQEQLKATNLELKNQNARKKLEEPKVPQPENAYQELQGTIKFQEQALQSLKEKYASLVLQKQQNSDEAKKLKERIKNLSGELDENHKKLKNSKSAANVFDKSMSKVKNATNSTISSLKKFASTLGIYLGLREIIRFSNEASKLAAQQEANIKRLSMLYGEAAQSVYDFANENAYAFGMAKSAAYDAAADYGNIFRTFADGAESAELTNKMLQATAVIASQTGRTYEDVFEKIRSGLYGNTRAIDDLGVSVRQSSLMQTEAYQQISENGTRSWNSLTDAELQHARALGIIEQSYAKYGNTVMQSAALTRSQFNAAWTDFKATWGQAVNLILLPLLNVATQVLTTLTNALQIIFHLTGKQLDLTKNVGTSIGIAKDNQSNLSDNIKNTNKGLKETNKELKKELASFDELEILSRDTANNSSGGGGGGAAGAGGGIGGIGGGDLTSGEFGMPQGEIDSKLAAVAGLVGAALVGLGILVMFSGHPWLGLGMVITGATSGLWAAAVLQDFATEDVIEKLTTLFTIVGVVAFNLGVLLLFTGKWKYGLGLMSTGVSAVATALGLGGFGGDIQTKVSKILVISGLIAFMLGVILLFVPNCWTYGLKLMASGASSVTIGTVLGGEELKQELETFCTKYWKILYAIGIIMVVAGIVLLLVNAAGLWKYAITLILVGITDLVATTLLGGEDLKQELQSFCVKYWKELYAIGALMVAIGIVLCFLKAYKYGITLILAGIATVATTTKLGGEGLKKELTTFSDKYWKEIEAISLLMVIIGIALCFTPAVGFGVALIVGGISAGVTAATLSWDTITAEIKTMVEGVEKWIKKYNLLLCILGIILLFVPGMLGIGVGLLVASGKSLGEEKDLSFSSLKEKLETQLTNVYTAVAGKVDKIKNKINEVFDGGKGNIKTKVSGGGAGGGTRTYSARSVSYEMPALARGAVLPANQPFLAVVGDQKRGTNVEAPAELIKQMAIQAIQEAQGSLQGQQTIREEHYYLDQTELMSVLYKLVKGGERIQGNSLINQGGSLV
jgi:hypothetical protein